MKANQRQVNVHTLQLSARWSLLLQSYHYLKTKMRIWTDSLLHYRIFNKYSGPLKKEKQVDRAQFGHSIQNTVF